MTQMPVNSPSLPGIRQPLLEGTSASRPYYLFLQWVATNLSSLSATVDDLSAQQGGISISPDANVTGQNSIKTRGALSEGIVQVLLQGDVSVAGNTQYYGSDQTGNKGWYAVSSAMAGSSNISLSTAADGVTTFDLTDVADSGAGSLRAITRDSKGRITGTRSATITGTAGRVTVANGDASAGLPTLDLATVADAGGGALLRFVRDVWGRISGTSAATTTDLTEGSNLYFTTARVLATVLAGLSTATRAVITAADTVLSALGKLQAQITGNAAIPAGYIDGLKMVWNSATSISVTSGAAYIQSLGYAINSPSTLTLSGLSLAPSTWYHLYGYVNAGTPSIELVTTAPAAPYSGTARSKTSDTSRRYIGSVLTDASGNLYNFLHNATSGFVSHLVTTDATPFRIVSNAQASGSHNVSTAGVSPLTARQIYVRLVNLISSPVGDILFVSNPDYTPTVSASAYIISIGNNINEHYVFHPVSTSQFINYFLPGTATTGGVYMDVFGYSYER